MKTYQVAYKEAKVFYSDTVKADYVEISQNGDALFMMNAPNNGLTIYAKGFWIKILEVKE